MADLNPKEYELYNVDLYGLLGQGVGIWNTWMQEHPDEPVNFQIANFEKRDLRGINLSDTILDQANFRGCILNKADLTEADLTEADLTEADLTKAELSGAKLHNANFSGANLRAANLSPISRKVSMEYVDKYLTYDTEFVSTNLNCADLECANLSNTDLTSANLLGANFTMANLTNANLSNVDLKGSKFHKALLVNANLSGANLSGVDLSGAVLTGANLSKANLEGAKLTFADLSRANLEETNFVNANLSNSQLDYAVLVQTNFINATLKNCSVYGISAWKVQLRDAIQQDLVITEKSEPIIKVDNLEVAQFIYLLLEHKKLRDVLDTVMERGVLLLGRFRDGGLELLQAIAEELRKVNYLPIIFDFERPAHKNLTENCYDSCRFV